MEKNAEWDANLEASLRELMSKKRKAMEVFKSVEAFGVDDNKR